MNGTRMSSTFDGTWVKTMVRSRPTRRATAAAARAEKPARTLAAPKMAPSVAASAPKRIVEPHDHRALDHEAAGEGVEGEQRRQAQHHVARAVQAEKAGTPYPIRRRGSVGLGRRATAEEQHRQQHADPGIDPEDRRGSSPASGRPAWSCRPWTVRPQSRAPKAVASEPVRLYQAKTLRAPLRRHSLGQRRLFDGQERPDLVAAGADDADRGGRSSSQKSSVDRNTAPASAIRAAPAISIHLRPMRSAVVVIHSDTATSPSSVIVSSRPMRCAR